MITLRVLLLICSIFLLVFLIFYTKYIVTTLIAGILILLQVIALIRFIESTNRRFAQFLEAIRYADFSSSFSEGGLGKNFEELNIAFNEVIREFRKTRKQKEEHFNYLQTVVEHISTGVIVYERTGQVDMVNNAFKKMFRLNSLKDISELARHGKSLVPVFRNVKAGDRFVMKQVIEDELLQLAVHATEFRIRDQELVLVSLQNIHYELEEKEMESWQKLTRVLTHEIMNSITPISSLASTIKDFVTDENGKAQCKENLDDETIESIQNALEAIERRSQGLLNFVNIYRNLTRIPKPNFRYFPMKELFQRVYELHKATMAEKNISFTMEIRPDDMKLLADPDLLEQVLINLIINAIHASETQPQPKIRLIAEHSNNKPYIHVIDNGTGIKPDLMEKIFIPFFTSKKDGSGIGLSLSRQIMFLHKGNIFVKSKPGEETEFTLRF